MKVVSFLEHKETGLIYLLQKIENAEDEIKTFSEGILISMNTNPG